MSRATSLLAACVALKFATACAMGSVALAQDGLQQRAAERRAEINARRIEAQCPRRGGKASGPREAGWKTIIDLGKGSRAIVVDGFKLPCRTMATCGTGGCALHITTLINARQKTIFNEFARGWEIERLQTEAIRLRLDLHGSRCGKTGAEDCYWSLDLKSGTRSRVQ